MSKSVAFLLVIVFLTASCVLIIPINADSRTIIVPDDYSTIQGAINVANEGDTIFVKKGTYEEQTLVINKTISLIGEDANNTTINLHPPWIPTGGYTMNGQREYGYDNPIKIQASDVKLSGFTIASDPVRNILTTATKIQIIGNVITTGLFVYGSYQNITQNILAQTDIQCYGSYNTVAENSIVGGSIVVGVTGSSNVVYGNTVTVGHGITLLGNGNRVFNNTVENCSEGVGVFGSEGSNNILYANRATNNYKGLYVAAEGSNNIFYANYVANNTIGASIGYDFPVGNNNTFYQNNFIDNFVQAIVTKATGIWDNGKEGNYWSDYNGTDNNGDEIGDTRYIINGGNVDNYPLMVPFDIFNEIIEPEPDSFPTTLIAVAIALVAIVSIGLLVYFKKRKH